MKKPLSVLSLLLLIPTLVFAQQTKVITAEKHNEYGLVYSLPVTALQITVTAQKETRTPGPYRQYAKRYLGTSDVIANEAVSWTIKDIQVTPVGVKGDDPTQYLMQLKAGSTTFIGVAPNGMLLSINTEPEEYNFHPFVGSVAGKVISSGGDVDEYLKFVDMDFVSAQNSMRQAEMVASSLMDARESREAIKYGTSDFNPTDSRQYEMMLNSINEQIDAMTRAFTGSVTVEEFSSQYIYIPEDEGDEVVFRLSDFNGLVDPDDYSGSPVYIKTEILSEGTLPLDANGEAKKYPKDGVVYGIPGTARITIYTDRKKLMTGEYEFSQFGTTFALSPTLFTDKKAPSFARFSPETGALLEIGKIKSAD